VPRFATVPASGSGTVLQGSGAVLQARADEENVVSDYNYENHRFELTDDRSRNSAQALEGYPLDITLDDSWPGVSANPNRQRFDADKMLEVADWIDQQVAAIQRGQFTPQALGTTSSVTYGPPDWNAANYLKQASGRVATTVSDYAGQLVTNLQAASTAIRNAAGRYGRAENTNTDSMTSQQNSAAGQQAPTSWT
jgi:hypothetical protein